MKATYRIGLKLPIDGVQFSNIETAMEWEIEGEDAEEIIEELQTKLDKWLDEQMESIGGRFKSTLQEQNDKLRRAREKFIEMQKGDDNGTFN